MAFELHKTKALLKALIKKLPLIDKIKNLKTRGTDESRYCYSVYMRHLLHLNTLEPFKLKCVVELGIGDSIGVGLVALHTDIDVYYALDVRNTIDVNHNVKILKD